MKAIYVIRHANWDGKNDALTEQGASDAAEYSAYLPDFAIVYSSPFIRAQQTAEKISELKPRVEAAASVPQSPAEVKDQILARRSTHPLGIAGALFETTEAHPALRTAGEALSQLIRQVLNELQNGQEALIVSHDGTMIAAERVLTNVDFTAPLKQTYNELEGFTVNEDLQLKRLEAMPNDNPQEAIARIRADLLDARKARDQLTTTTLQQILSDIDNAGAVPVSENMSSVGTGSTEMPRRELSSQDIRELVSSEITEAQHAIEELGNKESSYTGELYKRIAILKNYL